MSDDFNLTVKEKTTQIVDEFWRASGIHPPFHSRHEGFAVIQEEMEELWDAIKTNDHQNAIDEAVQLGAMALRFLVDSERFA